MTSILVCHVATCTYQEEPSWLDYPTVRHAKRWPSLDLVRVRVDTTKEFIDNIPRNMVKGGKAYDPSQHMYTSIHVVSALEYPGALLTRSSRGINY